MLGLARIDQSERMKYLYVILLCFCLLGCEPKEISVVYRAAGSSDDEVYGIDKMDIVDTRGGYSSFAFGATSGFPGAMASGGGMGVPASIDGLWRKPKPTQNQWGYRGFSDFYRIQAPIEHQRAAQKIRILRDYYEDFQPGYEGRFIIKVEEARVRLFYTLDCFKKLDNCRPKKGVDPEGWVVNAPESSMDVVALFDGIGESSKTPFPGTRSAEKMAYCLTHKQDKKCYGWLPSGGP